MSQDDLVSNYTVSIQYDQRLYKQDIAGSVAHARMLGRQGIIGDSDAQAIISGLQEIQNEIESGTFVWQDKLEDIHMNIESRLHEKIGEVAGKLHTARSRNDQVATDVCMYLKLAIQDVLDSIHGLQHALVLKADDNIDVIMPGYTHVQRAQPILFAHHMLAYYEMLKRDVDRFQFAYDHADVMHLGSGAIAGTPYPIDRNLTQEELGFRQISSNSMDSVSNRDFLLDFHSAAAICAMHMSRLAEDLVLWSSAEFGFIRIADEYTTGSSMMPQKRNPDFAEIARGKTGRVYGNLLSLLTTMKGLPLTYNRDLQEDKEPLFDTIDTLLPTLNVMGQMISTAKLLPDRMREAAENSGSLATDIADYLVMKGVPFRKAHGIVSCMSAYCESQRVQLHELPLEKYLEFSKVFEADVLDISIDSSTAARDIPGGTAPNRVHQAISEAKMALGLKA